jgi:hypothetical protein
MVASIPVSITALSVIFRACSSKTDMLGEQHAELKMAMFNVSLFFVIFIPPFYVYVFNLFDI